MFLQCGVEPLKIVVKSLRRTITIVEVKDQREEGFSPVWSRPLKCE